MQANGTFGRLLKWTGTARTIALAPLFLLTAAQAQAATLTVSVVDAAGKPVRDAVVVADLPGAHAAPVGRGYTVLQKDIAFHPFVLVVPVGATVSFPNGDNTRHHVYSFSPTKHFELKLFARDQSRSVLFDKAGAVALGCNIHDRMSAFVFVTANAWTARTDERGVAVLTDLPNAVGHLTIWHPYLRAPGNSVSVPLSAGQHTATATVRLRSPPMHDMPGY